LSAAGVLLVVAARLAAPPPATEEFDAVKALMAIASVHLKQSVPGAELLDIEVRADSSAEVAYPHDRLFDVVFLYRRDGQTRTITAPYGLKDGSWITPTKVELQSRDESALVVH